MLFKLILYKLAIHLILLIGLTNLFISNSVLRLIPFNRSFNASFLEAVRELLLSYYY